MDWGLFVSGRCQGKHGGVWWILDYQCCFLREGLSLGFGIWSGILLFWAVAPVGGLAWGDGGWFRVGFGHRGRRGEDWGWGGDFFLGGSS